MVKKQLWIGEPQLQIYIIVGRGEEAYYKAPMGVVEGDLNLKRKFLYNEENLI